MATEKGQTEVAFKYRTITGIAGLVGLIGGFLLGVWDSLTVIIDHGLANYALLEILLFFLYSVAIYTVIGCLIMLVIGAISSVIVKTGKYSVKKTQLAGIFIVVYVLLAVSVIRKGVIMSGNIVDVTEVMVIGISCGIGIAVIGTFAMLYANNKGMRKEKLIALCIALFISLLVLIYGGLLINIKLLPTESFFQPISLVSNIGLLILAVLIAAGLYRLSLLISRRFSPHRITHTGYVLLSIILCAFITISFIGPFSTQASQDGYSIATGAAKGKPNILWIVMDTVRSDHLSCYGYHRNTTPNIDRIASEGVLFENAISPAPWTLPSHASMFTGMFPSKHGTDAEHQWLEEDFNTIAEILYLYGYKTMAYSNNWYASPRVNLDQGFSVFEYTNMGVINAGKELTDYLEVSALRRNIHNNLLMDDGAQRTNEVVTNWIAEVYQEKTPFFLFINYMEAHAPYHPPREYVTPYLGNDVNMRIAMSAVPDLGAYNAGKVEVSDEDFDIIRALYDGEIFYLDYRMEKLFDYLRDCNILDNTILIITSDHGDNFGDHGLMDHQHCVYDTLLHVPLIIRYPESFRSGSRINEQVQTTDIFPTILDIIGIDWGGIDQIQGNSLVKVEGQRQSTYAIAELSIWGRILKILRDRNYMFDVSVYTRRLKTIRTEEYKYIWASDACDELYNIRQDPAELVNLIDTEPEKALELKNYLIDWLNSFELYRPEAIKQIK